MTLHRKHSNNNFFNNPLGASTRELNYPDPSRARLLASWEDFNLRRPQLSRLLVELFGEASAMEVHRAVNIIPESRAAGALGHLKPLKRKVRDLSNVSDS